MDVVILHLKQRPYMKVKVAQSCPTLCNPRDYRLWNSPGQNTGVDSRSLLQGIFPTQGLNPGFPHCRQILYQLSQQGSPRGCKQSFYFFSPCHIASCISQTLLQLGRHVQLRSDQRNKYRGHILLLGMTCAHRFLCALSSVPCFLSVC